MIENDDYIMIISNLKPIIKKKCEEIKLKKGLKKKGQYFYYICTLFIIFYFVMKTFFVNFNLIFFAASIFFGIVVSLSLLVTQPHKGEKDEFYI